MYKKGTGFLTLDSAFRLIRKFMHRSLLKCLFVPWIDYRIEPGTSNSATLPPKYFKKYSSQEIF